LSPAATDKAIQKLSAAETGIEFINTITRTKEHNVFTYQYYYNGNGVAVGDVNADGLTDVFITGNQTPQNFLSTEGRFHFKDVTAAASVGGKNAWRTGANMVDINGDGLLDIYVCYSGFGSEAERANELFINTGNNKMAFLFLQRKLLNTALMRLELIQARQLFLIMIVMAILICSCSIMPMSFTLLFLMQTG
jgi:hypothetical protein